MRHKFPMRTKVLAHSPSTGTRWKDVCLYARKWLCSLQIGFSSRESPAFQQPLPLIKCNAFHQVCVLNCKIEYLVLRSVKHNFSHRLLATRVKVALRKSTRSTVVNICTGQGGSRERKNPRKHDPLPQPWGQYCV
jgi:hypothetical protein